MVMAFKPHQRFWDPYLIAGADFKDEAISLLPFVFEPFHMKLIPDFNIFQADLISFNDKRFPYMCFMNPVVDPKAIVDDML